MRPCLSISCGRFYSPRIVWLFVLLACFQSWNAFAFNIGDKVQANGLVWVRQTAGGTHVGNQASGTQGTIVGGPVYAQAGGTGNTLTWYNIHWPSAPDGWVGDVGLKAVVVSAPAPVASATQQPASATVVAAVPSATSVLRPSINSVSPASMQPLNGNQTLTITGNNFQTGATLTFVPPEGSTITSSAAKLTVVSSSQISYQINNLSDSGTWTVRVNNPNGQSSGTASFIVASATQQPASATVVGAQQPVATPATVAVPVPSSPSAGVTSFQQILDRHEQIGQAPSSLPTLQNTYLWPRVKDYALISQAVYTFGSVPNYTDNCPIDGMECSKDIPGTSFQAQVYFSKTSKTLVIAFRGTEFGLSVSSLKDCQADLDNFFNGMPEQYEQAVTFANQVIDKAKPFGYEIVLTGHSLGGGLASYAALSCGKQAVVFNAAGLGGALRQKVFANLFDSAALVTNIDLDGDPISALPVKQVGTIYSLPIPATMIGRDGFIDARTQLSVAAVALNPDIAGRPVATTLNPFNCHYIKTVIDVLNSINK